MSQRQIVVFVFGLLAAVAAVIFFGISIDKGVYAPGASTVRAHVSKAGRSPLHRAENALPAVAKRNFTARRTLRKLYSIVAFGIVGFFAAPLVGRRRVAGDALVVAAFSAAIEVAQKLTGARESLWWNAFDIGCGALGGVLGALAFNALARTRWLRGSAVP